MNDLSIGRKRKGGGGTHRLTGVTNRPFQWASTRASIYTYVWSSYKPLLECTNFPWVLGTFGGTRLYVKLL